jgi:hypothetical protein
LVAFSVRLRRAHRRLVHDHRPDLWHLAQHSD